MDGGKNEITTNNFLYYENSHFRPIVGDIIIEELLSEDSRFKKSTGNAKSQ